jgi:hypothetical protein
MSNVKKAESDNLYSLIPLEDFKSILGVDDREDKLVRFCLVSATLSIEQYCMRKFLQKKYFEFIEFFDDLIIPLKEYPILRISNEKLEMSNGDFLSSEFFRVVPECGSDIDIPFSIEFSPVVKNIRGLKYFKVVYWAGYPKDKIPADLASACLELAAWNMNRYRGRRIGMTGNIRGSGKDGEHFEMSMPENVRALLEPYRRKTI